MSTWTREQALRDRAVAHWQRWAWAGDRLGGLGKAIAAAERELDGIEPVDPGISTEWEDAATKYSLLLGVRARLERAGVEVPHEHIFSVE